MKNLHNDFRLLIGAKEAADLLSISRSLFYEMKSSGQLGPMPISFGKRKLYRVEELKDWVNSGCMPREKWLQSRREE